MLTFYRSWLSIKTLEVPTVAAINGPAIGAGFALALACDIRYIAQNVKVGVPFTGLGLHPGPPRGHCQMSPVLPLPGTCC